jgi:hypothetical protein
MLAYCNKLQLTEIAIAKSRMLAFWYELARPTVGRMYPTCVVKHKRAYVNNCLFFLITENIHFRVTKRPLLST